LAKRENPFETRMSERKAFRNMRTIPFDFEGRGVRQLIHSQDAKMCGPSTLMARRSRDRIRTLVIPYDQVRTKRTRAGRSKLPGVAYLIGREVNFMWP
jgi:hypothetical protein